MTTYYCDRKGMIVLNYRPNIHPSLHIYTHQVVCFWVETPPTSSSNKQPDTIHKIHNPHDNGHYGKNYRKAKIHIIQRIHAIENS